MVVIEDNFNRVLKEDNFIALGGFDGIHLGHKALIEKTIELSKKNNCNSMTLTFKNHPLTEVNSELTPKLLMDNASKLEVLESLGVGIVNLMTFNKALMQLSPEEFIEHLVNLYKAKGIVVGFNFRFGYKNLGDVHLLDKLSKKYLFDLNVVAPVKITNEIVSSTKIRNLISEEGNVIKAFKMLGRPYSLKGRVIKGKQLGRELGFPTVNLDYSKDFVLPRGGVYYTLLEFDKNFYKGMTNIGYNPTVHDKKLSIETHILDFNLNLYGKEITLHFINRIRDEKRFESLEDLQRQLNKDRNFIKKQKFTI